MNKDKLISDFKRPDNELVEKFDKELGKLKNYTDKACKHCYSEPFSPTILMARKKLKIFN